MKKPRNQDIFKSLSVTNRCARIRTASRKRRRRRRSWKSVSLLRAVDVDAIWCLESGLDTAPPASICCGPALAALTCAFASATSKRKRGPFEANDVVRVPGLHCTIAPFLLHSFILRGIWPQPFCASKEPLHTHCIKQFQETGGPVSNRAKAARAFLGCCPEQEQCSKLNKVHTLHTLPLQQQNSKNP